MNRKSFLTILGALALAPLRPWFPKPKQLKTLAIDPGTCPGYFRCAPYCPNRAFEVCPERTRGYAVKYTRAQGIQDGVLRS